MTGIFKRSAEYIRYSSHNQDDGYSIEYQQSEIKQYAEKNGIIVENSFIDAAKTGTKVAGREQFYEMIRAVKDGKIDTIIVYKMSRIFRNSQESQYYRDLFRNKGVQILSVTEYIDETSTSGRLSTNILSIIDQYQSEIISDHVKSSMREMVRQGYYTGGKVIFGYSLEIHPHGKKKRKKFIINDDEAETVNKIFQLFANNYGRAEIMRYLMENHITKRDGSYFTDNQIYKMLINDFYIGVRRWSTKDYDDIVIENSHPALVSATVWQAVQNRLKNKSVRPKLKKQNYTLTGKMFCSCGSHFYGVSSYSIKNGVKYDYFSYVCAEKKKYRKCAVPQINKNFIENAVLSAIKSEILTPEKIDCIANEIFSQFGSLPTVLDGEIKELKKEIANLNSKIDILIEMRLNGEISGEIIKQRSAPLEERLFNAEKRLSEITERQRGKISLEDTKNYLNAMLLKSNLNDTEIAKELFTHFVHKIVVTQTRVKIHLRVYSSPNFAFKSSSASPNVDLYANKQR